MFGTNKIAKIVKRAKGIIAVTEIFTTLQGEGPYTGQEAVFIRLGGCNLRCSFCDTEFDNFSFYRLSQIVERVQALLAKENFAANLIVIT